MDINMTLRNQCKQYLNEFMSEKNADALEKIIYERTDSEFSYKIRARSYLCALKRKTWKYGDICNNSFDLDSKKWNNYRAAEEKMDSIVAEQQKPVATSMYTCGRCKKKECTFYTMQTRSADESETIFITCINCGNKWKQ